MSKFMKRKDQSNFIAILLLVADLKVAIEVALDVASSSDGGLVLGILIFLFILVNVTICSSLGFSSFHESTARKYYFCSIILSIITFSCGVYFEQFFGSSGDDVDRLLFALVSLSLAPFALLTANSASWSLLVQFGGWGISVVTQLALLAVTSPSSYSLWLTWILYISFFLLTWLHSNNHGIEAGKYERIHCGGVVSPEPSLSSPGGEEELIAKVTEDSRIIRQLIGNVAHDLKTPLSSFMVGLGLIHDWIHDLQHLCKHASRETHALLNQIETALHDAQITDTFMIATMNTPKAPLVSSSHQRMNLFGSWMLPTSRYYV